MKSFLSSLMRYAQDVVSREHLLMQETAAEKIKLIRFLCSEATNDLRVDQPSDEDCRLVLQIAGELFLQPSRSSRDLADELVLEREDLVRFYRIIKNVREIQDVLTFESPMRRRVSFLRKELLPDNIPTLKAMFNGNICMPSHVEFHPALICNLRCKACPNIHSDSGGDWHFLGYPQLGQPLSPDRLRLTEDMFLNLGVESFSFGGGGEPSLSDLTLDGIAHLRGRSSTSQISLYTNGIFPKAWADREYETLVTCLNKIRFSIDSANAQEWSQYKGRPPELFETLWENIQNAVAARRRMAGTIRIGASCLVSKYSYRNVESFLVRARATGLDFCDIKAVETCFGEKAEYKAKSIDFRKSFDELMAKVRDGFFAPMDVVVDDSLLPRDESTGTGDIHPTRCWVAIRGRMLTVGPYGELHPCPDAANPGTQSRRGSEKSIGQLSAFDSLGLLESQFTALWSESLARRTGFSRANCAYCVPSHNNYNLTVEKLFQDWSFGIMPEDQPLAGEKDHYLSSRG
jgi:MoaA/NifB/PqqE/SkfB family radical SAM enzyme